MNHDAGEFVIEPDIRIFAQKLCSDSFCERAKSVSQYPKSPVDRIIYEYADLFKCKPTKKHNI